MKRFLYILIHLLFFGGIVTLGYFSLEYAKECGLAVDNKIFIFLCIYCGVCLVNSIIVYFYNLLDDDSLPPLIIFALFFFTMIVVAIWSKFLIGDDLHSAIIKGDLRIGFVYRFLCYSLPVFVGYNIYFIFVYNWDGAHIEYEEHEFPAYVPLIIFTVLNVAMYFVHQYVPVSSYNYTYWISFGVFALTFLILFFAFENAITTMIFEYSDYKNKRGAYANRPDSPSEIRKKAEQDYKIKQDAFTYRVIDATYSFLKGRYIDGEIRIFVDGSTLVIKGTFKRRYDSKSQYEDDADRLARNFKNDAVSYASSRLEDGDNISDVYANAVVEGEYWD